MRLLGELVGLRNLMRDHAGLRNGEEQRGNRQKGA